MKYFLQISRSLLQEAGQPKEECTGNLIEKAKCLAAQAADTVGNAASSAANTVVDTYNNVVGNDKNTTTTAPTNGTAPANGTTPASSAVATSGFAAIAVATVFALAY